MGQHIEYRHVGVQLEFCWNWLDQTYLDPGGYQSLQQQTKRRTQSDQQSA
jgi:hypothetical protein